MGMEQVRGGGVTRFLQSSLLRLRSYKTGTAGGLQGKKPNLLADSSIVVEGTGPDGRLPIETDP